MKLDKRRKPYNLWVCVVGIILLLTISGSGFMLILKNPGEVLARNKMERHLEKLKSELNIENAVFFDGLSLGVLKNRVGENILIDIDSSKNYCGEKDKFNFCMDECNDKYVSGDWYRNGYEECRNKCEKFYPEECEENEVCVNNYCTLPNAERKKLSDIEINIEKEVSLADYNLKTKTTRLKISLHLFGSFLSSLGIILCSKYIGRYYWKKGEYKK